MAVLSCSKHALNTSMKTFFKSEKKKIERTLKENCGNLIWGCIEQFNLCNLLFDCLVEVLSLSVRKAQHCVYCISAMPPEIPSFFLLVHAHTGCARQKCYQSTKFRCADLLVCSRSRCWEIYAKDGGRETALSNSPLSSKNVRKYAEKLSTSHLCLDFIGNWVIFTTDFNVPVCNFALKQVVQVYLPILSRGSVRQ